MAGPRRLAGGSMIAVVVVILFAFAPSAGAATLTKAAYPSANSQIVGSVGFIDGCQVGYFWSKARGDSVTETIGGPGRIKHAVLNVAVVSNNLNGGSEVDWTLSINGKTVDSFVVSEGFLGTVHRDVTFTRINGPNYTVKLAVTNEVPGGGGSVTFAYADCGGAHSIKLARR
jgi:hypothetical protein